MDAASLLRTTRSLAGLSLRELASRAGTSHSALAAYESGRTVPNVHTLDRIVRAAGFAADVTLERRVGRDGGGDRAARGRELVEALELASMFPARHDADLRFPPFGRVDPAAAA